MSPKKRHFIKPVEPESDATDSGIPSEKGDNLILVERMVQELLHSMSALALAKASEVNYVTIRKIAKGESKRISKKVLFAIQKFYNRYKAGDAGEGAPARRGRRPKSASVPAAEKIDKGLIFPLPDPAPAQSPGRFSVEAIQSEITALERRMSILRKLQELAKDL